MEFMWYNIHVRSDNMPVSDSRRRANDKYNAKCGRIELRPLREDVEAIRAVAAEAGQSLQGYILQAVRERMEREGKGGAGNE